MKLFSFQRWRQLPHYHHDGLVKWELATIHFHFLKKKKTYWLKPDIWCFSCMIKACGEWSNFVILSRRHLPPLSERVQWKRHCPTEFALENQRPYEVNTKGRQFWRVKHPHLLEILWMEKEKTRWDCFDNTVDLILHRKLILKIVQDFKIDSSYYIVYNKSSL